MRKILLAALAALTLAGCHKTVSEPVQALILTSEEPSTRTGWNGETIEWTAGDAISMAYSVNGSFVGPNLYPSDALTENSLTAAFRVPGNFPTDLVGAHHFYAVYPAVEGTDFSGAPDVFTAVPEIQTPTATSFDPAADLMAATSTGDWRSLPASPIPMIWTRLTAHGDITLKNLALDADETVQSIVLQAQNGAELTGDVIIDLCNTEEFATAGVPRVTVLADNLSVDASGNLRFWVSIFPVELTELTVTLTTDKAVYRRSIQGISKIFAQNTRNILGISMQGATKTPISPMGENYVKVTQAQTDWTGDYLIVYEADGLVLDSDGDAKTHASVSISDGKIPYESAKAYNIRIEKSGTGYSMKMGDNYYGLNSSSNALNVSTSEPADNYRWTFQTTNGVTRAYNVKYPTRFLQFNASSKQFRCYTSAQKDVTFFKLDGEAPGGGGGGTTPVTASVTTGSSSNVTQTEATLSATYTGTPTYGGVEWGLSADDLSEDWQAEYLNSGSFNVTINGLGAGHTYYYRAYIAVLEGTEYRYYYGEVKSFTTPAGEIVIGGDQPGWYETPMMNISKSGNYRVNTDDPTQYYAIHMCSGGEKGPGGKTARNYTVCFSAEHHCPVWVAAPRHSMYVGSSGRNDSYRRDPDIPADIQYVKKSADSGCNNGHMLGSAERTSSKATNRDVFYFTNIAPQLSTGFNTGGGGWNILEDFVDGQQCSDTLYVVIGCYFDRFTDGYGKTANPKTISFGGRNDVSQPTMFYYALIRTKNGKSGKALKDCSASEIKCAAFVRTHTNDLKGQIVSSREMMSISDLERITGVTYFPNVPNAPKDTFNASDWGL